jgi:tetratricopeptide (TPR) repeat protein
VTDLNNLATVYSYQDRYAEAESLYRRALEISQNALGQDSPGLVMLLSNMSALYEKMGKRDEAESLQDRAKKIYESQMP